MSLVLSADGQNLDSGNSTTLWTGAQSFTLAAWFKKASDQSGSLFGVFRSSSPELNSVILRFAYERFDHGVKLNGADLRMTDSGLLTSGWNLAVLTVNGGVEMKSYFNGTLANTMAIAGSNWAGPASRIIVGSHTINSWDTGRGKIAHAALWDTILSAAQVADLYNGGAGGAGKSPTAVASANLRTYLPLISNATDEKGTFTLTATGSPTYDGADNPNVEAYGGGSVDGAASGATLTGTSSLTAGGASGTASGTATGANLTGTSSISAGAATGNATGSFTTAAMENNSGAGLLASTSVAWTWYEGAIGAAPTSTTHGTGTTNGSGILTVTGLPVAAGFLLARTTDSSGVYYQSGTPA